MSISWFRPISYLFISLNFTTYKQTYPGSSHIYLLIDLIVEWLGAAHVDIIYNSFPRCNPSVTIVTRVARAKSLLWKVKCLLQHLDIYLLPKKKKKSTFWISLFQEHETNEETMDMRPLGYKTHVGCKDGDLYPFQMDDLSWWLYLLLNKSTARTFTNTKNTRNPIYTYIKI